jgi:hypothetical protein
MTPVLKPLLLTVLLAAGCGSVQIPPDRLERSEASMRTASEMGAEGVPAARLYLELARDQAKAARRLAASGNDRALLVLARSQADAELALALAREASVHVEAERAQQELNAVQSRKGP